MATIKDVAKWAGVSIATVSRVINQRGYISEETKQKVNHAMKELNYEPNDIARSLYKQRSHIIGLIVPSVKHPFFGEVATYLEYYAYQQGYKMMVCNSLNDKEKEQEYISMLKRSQVDGIVMGSHTLDIDAYLNLNLPVISLDRQLGDTIPYICCDNYQGGELAARHLILDKLCENLLHISGSLSVKMLSNRRTEAFLACCKELRVPCKAYELPDNAITAFDEMELIREILSQNRCCDGVFTTSDVMAANVIRVAGELGIRVPEKLKVVGFDGGLISDLYTPQITTVAQPVDAICKYAVEYLIRQVHEEAVPNKTILPVTLCEKGSTK